MSYILQTNRLTKVFQGKEIVSNVTMKIEHGQIYGFLGPNGAGKTSIMKMITNLVKPTSGDIELFGERLTPKSYDLLKRMGNIIEYPIFYEKLSARENLELHCAYMGFHQLKAIDEALELVKLTNTGKQPVKEFSLGMKQRLGIARAITTKPEFLILDEPINGLDPVGIRDMRDLFIMLSKEYGITLLISSHLLGEIEQIADTIGVINNGRLIEEVSMNSIRESNMDYIEITTTDIPKAVYVLEHRLQLPNYKVVGDDVIRVYEDSVSPSDISKTLILNDVAVNSIHRKQNSLEDHFFQILNGGEQSA